MAYVSVHVLFQVQYFIEKSRHEPQKDLNIKLSDSAPVPIWQVLPEICRRIFNLGKTVKHRLLLSKIIHIISELSKYFSAISIDLL